MQSWPRGWTAWEGGGGVVVIATSVGNMRHWEVIGAKRVCLARAQLLLSVLTRFPTLLEAVAHLPFPQGSVHPLEFNPRYAHTSLNPPPHLSFWRLAIVQIPPLQKIKHPLHRSRANKLKAGQPPPQRRLQHLQKLPKAPAS